MDPNAPHYSLALPGGAQSGVLLYATWQYLAYVFTGSIIDMRTTWLKRSKDSPIPADEFRAFVRGNTRDRLYFLQWKCAKAARILIRLTGNKNACRS